MGTGIGAALKTGAAALALGLVLSGAGFSAPLATPAAAEEIAPIVVEDSADMLPDRSDDGSADAGTGAADKGKGKGKKRGKGGRGR